MTKNGEFPWLKIFLGQVYCVEKVERRNEDSGIRHIWICTERNCIGAGEYVDNFYMTISSELEEATLNLSPIPDCSFGDTVTFGRKIDNTLRSREIVIIGRETIGVQGKLGRYQGAGKRPRQCCHPKGGNGAEGPKGPRTKGTATRGPEGPESGQSMRVRGPEGPEDEQS